MILSASSGTLETCGADDCDFGLLLPDFSCAGEVSGKQKIARNKILTKPPTDGMHFHRVFTISILLRRLAGNSGVIPGVNQLLPAITSQNQSSAGKRLVCFPLGIRHAIGLLRKLHFAALCCGGKNVSFL
ncbi:MAG: hypothetical protein NXI04_24700 [Planctomycetaceae bacterium]|nr:hypothetical protein [Planctomycetaceae bacterium]